MYVILTYFFGSDYNISILSVIFLLYCIFFRDGKLQYTCTYRYCKLGLDAPFDQKHERDLGPMSTQLKTGHTLLVLSLWNGISDFLLRCGFLCSSLLGEDSQFDKYFSKGLKPPTS